MAHNRLRLHIQRCNHMQPETVIRSCGEISNGRRRDINLRARWVCHVPLLRFLVKDKHLLLQSRGMGSERSNESLFMSTDETIKTTKSRPRCCVLYGGSTLQKVGLCVFMTMVYLPCDTLILENEAAGLLTGPKPLDEVKQKEKNNTT